MAARFVADNPHDRSKDYDVSEILQVGRRDHHAVCARRRRDTAVPHSRAAAGTHLLSKVKVDLVKEGKKLMLPNDFW
jgi:hypothetical protein